MQPTALGGIMSAAADAGAVMPLLLQTLIFDPEVRTSALGYRRGPDDRSEAMMDGV
jgi:hypothetical protein